MSQHLKTDFKHFSKEVLDTGLTLHGLKPDTPSQLSDSFRSGAEWAIQHYIEVQTLIKEGVCKPSPSQ